MPTEIEQQVKKKSRLASHTVYEIISREGIEEMSRPISSLGWSGLAAGLCICFSIFTQVALMKYLPDTSGSMLIAKMGYVAGFLIVIKARLQLFTENTITVILPLLDKLNWRNFMRTIKLWGVVFTTNMLGTFLMAILITYFSVTGSDYMDILIDVSLHAVDKDLYTIFIAGIPAGFLIAVMVWMMPSAKGQELLVIFVMIYLIALGDYSHVVAGSFEAFVVILSGDISVTDGLLYILAAGLGNIIGGTGIFTLLAYAQVKDEI